ncbi:MAG: hypothetical protein QJR13_00505 [Bacillota bacterium]|nr:hypothetical protein [Bacillota bacterium]
MEAYVTYYLLVGSLGLYLAFKIGLIALAYYLLKATEDKARARLRKEREELQLQLLRRRQEKERRQEAERRRILFETPLPSVRSLAVRSERIFS